MRRRCAHMLVLGRACWGQPICMRSQTLPRYQHRALTRSCPSSSNCNSTGFVLLSLDSSPFHPLFSIAVCVCASHSSTFCDRGFSSLISLHVSSRSHSVRAETERKKDGGFSSPTLRPAEFRQLYLKQTQHQHSLNTSAHPEL